jgi:hypothetical protein
MQHPVRPASRLRRGAKIIALGLLAAVAIPTIVSAAVGGDPAPKRYTGCLTSTGSLVQIKAGDAPRVACTSTQSKVTVANGDITGLTAGAGLVGGGLEGTVGLSIAPKYALPQACAAGTPAKASATGWYCGSDNGTFKKTVTGLNLDKNKAPLDGNKCVGDYYLTLIPPYDPPSIDATASSASFTLPTGTYLPTTTASTKWFVSRTYDMLDGEQFSKGHVRMRLLRTRSGVESEVTAWARSSSENLDGSGLPFTQDVGVFTALAGDTYRVVADAQATYCTRSRLINGGMDFILIG